MGKMTWARWVPVEHPEIENLIVGKEWMCEGDTLVNYTNMF